MTGGRFFVDASKPSGWTHYVLNFLGMSSGIEVYVDGTLVGSDTMKSLPERNVGERRIVIGRDYFTSYDGNRDASVTVDELLFFNQQLNQT